MISQTAEYALRAIFYLSEHNDKPLITQQIAEGTHVPVGYLSKVLQQLNKGGLVNAQRGLGGGFVLARPPKEITIYDVMQCVEPLKRIHTCPLKLGHHGTNLCPLHRKLDDAIAAVEKMFKESTIADILSNPSTSRPLCPFPFVGPAEKDKNKKT